MSKQLRCDCGNVRRWTALSTGPNGTVADCRVCGKHLDKPDVTSPFNINVSNTDNTVIGNDDVQINIY